MVKTRQSQSKRAGLILPVARFQNKFKTMPAALKRVTRQSGVYMAAVIEYMTG